MQKLMEPYNQFDEKDKQALRELCAKVQKNGVRILEIGCWLGHATSILAECAQDNNGLVICVDNFKGSPGTFLPEYAETHDVRTEFIENMESLKLMRNIALFPADSDTVSYFFRHKSFDLIFIDGDHRYNKVASDIIDLLPLVNDSGIISGHDYEPGINFDVSSVLETFLNEDMHKGFHCGVIRAVDRYVRNFKLCGSRIWWAIR